MTFYDPRVGGVGVLGVGEVGGAVEEEEVTFEGVSEVIEVTNGSLYLDLVIAVRLRWKRG